MKRFFLWIEIEHRGGVKYEGIVLAGVSFKDQKGLTVKITKQHYKYFRGLPSL